MKIVCDTNVLVSSFIFPGGVPDQILNLTRLKQVQLVLSPEIITEFKKVLLQKFKYTENETVEFLDRLLNVAELVYPKERIEVIKRVPADNRILECAIEAKADYLVTGDKKDILPLQKIADTKIVSPRQFLDLYNSFS